MNTPTFDGSVLSTDEQIPTESNTPDINPTVNRLLPQGAVLSEEQERAVEHAVAGKNVVILGKAGVGKSTTVYSILEALENEGRKYVVCAPTGVAAVNVDGITVHRLISMLRKRQTKQINNGEGFDTILIDEVSMLRADLFDELDQALRAFSYDSGSALGGFQLILIGDPGQLPPVINRREAPEEADFLKTEYFSEFFFSAACYAKSSWEVIELTKIFRQEGAKYPKLLNMIRSGENTKTVKYLNKNHTTSSPKGAVLTARNADASEINRRELAKIPGRAERSYAQIDNIDPEYVWKKNEYPADEVLELKIGAKVMLIKNIYRLSGRRNEDGQLEYVMLLTNGDIGTVVDISSDMVLVEVPRINQTVEILKFEDGCWEKTKVDGYVEHQVKNANGEIKKGKDGKPKTVRGKPTKKVVARFSQFPLRLAYAMTIHKAQGATISEPFTIDLRRPMFAAGQLYVALSRGTKLENLHILGRVRPRDVIASKTVNAYLDGFMAGVGIKEGSTFHQLEQELAEEEADDGMDELDKILAMEAEED